MRKCACGSEQKRSRKGRDSGSSGALSTCHETLALLCNSTAHLPALSLDTLEVWTHQCTEWQAHTGSPPHNHTHAHGHVLTQTGTGRKRRLK